MKFCETLYKRRCSSLGRFGRLNRDHRALISDEKEPRGGFVVIVRRYCLARCIFSVEGEKSTGQNHEVEYHAGETRRASRRIYIYIYFSFLLFPSILNANRYAVSIALRSPRIISPVSSVTCIAINNPSQLKMGIGLKRVWSIQPGRTNKQQTDKSLDAASRR